MQAMHEDEQMFCTIWLGESFRIVAGRRTAVSMPFIVRLPSDSSGPCLGVSTVTPWDSIDVIVCGR